MPCLRLCVGQGFLFGNEATSLTNNVQEKLAEAFAEQGKGATGSRLHRKDSEDQARSAFYTNP